MSTNISSLGSWLWDARDGREVPSSTVVGIAVTMITVLGLASTVRKLIQAGPPRPPGPRGLPVLGHIPLLRDTDLHAKFTEFGKIYGPIYKLWMGSRLYVVISSPSLMKEIVRDNDVIFANRDPTIVVSSFTYGTNNIVWTNYGPLLKKLRKLLARDMLSKPSLDASYGLRKEEVRRVVNDVYKRCRGPVDVGDLAFTTGANVIIRMLCGAQVRPEDWTDFVADFKVLAGEMSVLIGNPNVSDLFPALAIFDFQGMAKKAKKIAVRVDKLLGRMVDVRSNYTKNEKLGIKNDFLQILIDCLNSKDPETSITFDQLKGTLLDVILGGTDTTSTTIEWAMTELIHHPEVMEKVQKELEEVVGMTNIVEEFHMPKLHYLEAVVKETLRLHPAVPMLLPHVSSQSCVVGGYTIPKNSKIFLNVYGMHRDPQFWEDPLEFKPERFLNNDFDFMGSNIKFLPFGAGRRSCAGVPLADKMLVFILGSLVHSFDWKMPPGTELELSERFGIVVKKAKNLVIIPTPRLPSNELYSM